MVLVTTMCFQENQSFFKAINWCFCAIHLVVFSACVAVIKTRDTPLQLYYQMQVTHDQYIDVYPIYAPLFTHGFGILFHFGFAMMSRRIVDEYFSHNFTNPLRWFLQFSADGMALVGLMLIHGFGTIESVALVWSLYGAIIGFCYYQDHYLNPHYSFRPDKEPHMFAIPLHLIMILMIIGKANEHINDEKSLHIALLTLIPLAMTLMSHIFQRYHIAYRTNFDEDDDDEDGDGENDLENVGSKCEIDRLGKVLDEMRRGIQYEAYYYTNSGLFAITVTWFIINITQSDQVLH